MEPQMNADRDKSTIPQPLQIQVHPRSSVLICGSTSFPTGYHRGSVGAKMGGDLMPAGNVCAIIPPLQVPIRTRVHPSAHGNPPC